MLQPSKRTKVFWTVGTPLTLLVVGAGVLLGTSSGVAHTLSYGTPRALAATLPSEQTPAGNPIIIVGSPNSNPTTTSTSKGQVSTSNTVKATANDTASTHTASKSSANTTNGTSKTTASNSSSNSHSNGTNNSSNSSSASLNHLPPSVQKVVSQLVSEESSTLPLQDRVSAVENSAQSLEMQVNTLEAQWGNTENKLQALHVQKSSDKLYSSLMQGYGNAFQQAFNIFNDVMSTNKQLVNVKTSADFVTLDNKIIADEKDISELTTTVSGLHSQISSLQIAAPSGQQTSQSEGSKTKTVKGK